ncbi:putative O-methyltransferase YrrM [Lewinella marina]|uniref:Methyltransferase n=1 Tax=Neolewinella marina TaxID=438751 RepID=A0A2G0CGZ9_9BACT|nr:O-methyltransferase [Neolewinella marina]NJB86282.1 putative O-methyltransferase YrrM [Neolewinella marina]PHK99246.1 methyltransferase [Neolewinella marina]
MRDRIDPLTEYAEALSGPVPDYLEYVERQTHLKTLAPQMMSGRLQGRLLAMLSKLKQPRRILEIGTFTGYATLCLAEGLAPGGRIDTIEGDPEIALLARRHFAHSPFADRITLHQGQARHLLPTLPGSFDLVFLDGDKRGYPAYLSALVDRLSPGGLLLADNVLWDGKAGRSTPDRTARKLREYNEMVVSDPRLESVTLPIRDGLSVSRHIG